MPNITGLQRAHNNLIGEALATGLQSYVKQGTLTASSIIPVSSTQFYSTITNRAAITDINNDLRASFGIDRIPVQSLALLQTEFGPNGEQVFGVLGDTIGQIRFAGNWSSNYSNGIAAEGAGVTSQSQGDFVEITFFGTGLNLVGYTTSIARDMRVTVDGGTEGSNIYTSGASGVLATRNYPMNTIQSLASGLTLGVHTVKLRNAGASSNLLLAGFEIVNANSATVLNVNAGTAYIDGLKSAPTAAQTLAYNTGVTGARGGRQLVYLKSDATLGSAFQAVNSAAAFMTAADHTNEEIARTYHIREFGAGRTDDFSTLTNASASARAFTLDDDTTTLVTNNGVIGVTGEGLAPAGTGDFVTFTFVGTGVDIVNAAQAATATSTITVDGNVVGTSAVYFSGVNAQTKIASGLPYGTHTVKIQNTSNATSARLAKFVVYQPKKPTLPIGAIELADFNVFADYSISGLTGTAVTDNLQVPAGVLYKTSLRELTVIGTGWSVFTTSVANSIPGGWYLTSATSGNSFSYTFFGTGAVIQLSGSGTASAYSLSVDGSAFATATALTNFTNGGGGNYSSTSAGGDIPCRLAITGLALGIHTIKLTQNSANNFNLQAVYVITPVHSAKSNSAADFQNTLTVGSQAISDNRKTTILKEKPTSQKYRGVAMGINSAPTTSSTVPVPCPDMSLAVPSPGAWFRLSFVGNGQSNTVNGGLYFQFVVDGLQVGAISRDDIGVAAKDANRSNTALVYLAPGTHKIDTYWFVSSGTGSISGAAYRSMTVEEL